jgi:hypothetical protein
MLEGKYYELNALTLERDYYLAIARLKVSNCPET